MATPSEHPALDHPDLREAATVAVDQFLADLQTGLDEADADRYEARFAGDVLWGSPYGATLGSSADLLPIHRALMEAGAAPPSRFEVVQLRAPAPGVAIAHIRREAVSKEAGSFSEMALYVLVEREGRWWLAAGRTPRSLRRRSNDRCIVNECTNVGAAPFILGSWNTGCRRSWFGPMRNQRPRL
jgi:hypothetical protein